MVPSRPAVSIHPTASVGAFFSSLPSGATPAAHSGFVKEGRCLSKRWDTLLKIAKRFSFVVVSGTHELLLANSETPKCRLTHHPSEGIEAWSTPCGNLHIPSDLVVDRRTAYIECSSALDSPLRHEPHAQDLL